MTMTVIDSHNLAAVLADAGAEGLEPRIDMTKPTPEKAEAVEKVEKVEKVEAEDADDVEGEDGTTAQQKRELSAKMLKAIGKKHRQVREAEEFAEAQYKEKTHAERRSEALERENAELKAKISPVLSSNKLDRNMFATEDDYTEALVDQRFARRDAEQKAEQTTTRLRSQIERASDLVPDWKEVTASADVDVPRAVSEYMQESELFAELGYHFAKNPDVLDKLGRFSVNKQLVELGKIEAKLTAFGTKEPKTSAQRAANDSDESSSLDTGFSPSKARRDAPVITPLNSAEGQQMEPDARDMNLRETIQTWQKANKLNLRLRKRH